MLFAAPRRVLLAAFACSSCSAAAVPVDPRPEVPCPAVEVAGPSNEAPAGALQVAITVDDLPAHGPQLENLSSLEIHQRLLAAFDSHHIPQVYGFINADKLEHTPELRASLEAWVSAGHPLGNHTYRHSNLHEISLDAYFEDIAANEPILDALVGDMKRTPTFRYPYLLEGTSREDTLAIRDHLDARGYRVAPITIDFYDWAFNAAYARCATLHEEAAMAALRKSFISHAIEMLAWSDAAAQALFGRRIPQILLLHSGAIDAVLIEELLEAMEDEGVTWISLDAALSDPAYTTTYVLDGRTQGTMLDQKIDSEGGAHPPRHVHPRALLEAMCPASDPDKRVAGR